jgi:hypothetical protein
VITAIGLKLASAFLQKNFNLLLLYYPAKVVELLSIALVVFVLFKYLEHLFLVKKQGGYQPSELQSNTG